MRRLAMLLVPLLAVGVAAAGPAESAAPSDVRSCVARLVAGPRPPKLPDAQLLCARPKAASTTVSATWSTCAGPTPTAEEDCETGSWTLRSRSVGRFGNGNLASSIGNPLHTADWAAKGSGVLTCKRDRANTPPDFDDTPLDQRFHRAGSFRVTAFTLIAFARGSRMTLSAVGTFSRAVQARIGTTCGPVIAPNDPTFGRSFPVSAVVGARALRDSTRKTLTYGFNPALLGGTLRVTVDGTTSVTFSPR